MLRKTALLVVVGVAATLAGWLVVMPWYCNLVEGEVERATDRIWARRDDFASRAIAETNLARLERCLSDCDTSVGRRMLAATNLVVLKRWPAAAAMYEEALRLDQRPELYLGLGLANVESGRREAALENFVAAGMFSGSASLNEIPDAELREKAFEIVGRRYEAVAQSGASSSALDRVRNGRFEELAARKEVIVPDRGTAASPADGWLLRSVGGRLSAAITESTRVPGRNALRLSASAAGSGIVQIWPRASRVPRARTTAWVFVLRGKVLIGSGTGAPPLGNAHSTTIGQWERLEGVNETCPAGSTVIYSASDDTEFLVDEVSVVETLAAPPCDQ